MTMKWVAIEDELPPIGLAVLVRRSEDNWYSTHTVANGEERKIWRWVAATRKEPYIGSPDSYEWYVFGRGASLSEQEVSHWCAISDPCESDDDAIQQKRWDFAAEAGRVLFGKEE